MELLELTEKNDLWSKLIADIYERVDLTLEFKELQEIKLKLAQKRMCQEMLRKDFELLQIQESFCQIFGDAELFSQPNDDLLSIEHAIQIAYQKAREDFVGNQFEVLYECGCQLAFSKDLGTAEEKANFFTTLIFQASTFIEGAEGINFFLKEFIDAYPEIDMTWALPILDDLKKNNRYLQ